MSAADAKEVKIHEFTAKDFLGPNEHILCAVIIGPDRDEPDEKNLHFRAHSAAIDILRTLPVSTRRMIAEHFDRLMREFKEMLLR